MSASAIPDRVVAAIRALPSPVCAYVYDRPTLRACADAVRSALPPGALLCYAVKANGHPDVVATLAGCVDGLEVASAGELTLAQRAAAQLTKPQLVVFGGPAKTDSALRAAVAAGAIVHVESVHELRRLAAIAAPARGAPTHVQVALRVNRATATPGASHQMTGAATQFGLDEAALPAVVAVAAANGIQLIGFGLHAVSNSLDAQAHAAYVVDAARWSVSAAKRLGMATASTR
jgi:diaminopimelate decarboxylase